MEGGCRVELQVGQGSWVGVMQVAKIQRHQGKRAGGVSTRNKLKVMKRWTRIGALKKKSRRIAAELVPLGD